MRRERSTTAAHARTYEHSYVCASHDSRHAVFKCMLQEHMYLHMHMHMHVPCTCVACAPS